MKPARVESSVRRELDRDERQIGHILRAGLDDVPMRVIVAEPTGDCITFSRLARALQGGRL